MSKLITVQDDLAARVAERQEQVKKYVEFALELIRDIGQQTFYEQSRWNTKVTREVKDFAGFDFEFDSRSSDTVTIRMRRKHPDCADFMPLTAVLLVSWQGCFKAEDCCVGFFETNLDWMTTLDKVIKNKKNILASMETAEKTQEKLQAEAVEKANADEALRKKAICLGLLPNKDKPAF